MIQSTARPEPAPEGGVQLVREWTPPGQPIGDVVLVHGIGEHSGRYERTGSLLAEGGYRVRGFDLIGFGASSGERGDVHRWSLYLDQIQEHLGAARTPDRPLVLLGHSMGGLLALEYALAERPQPDLLVLSAPGLSGGEAWQRKLAPVLGRALATTRFPTRVKGEMLSKDPAVGEAYFADPLVLTKATARLGAAIFAAGDRVRAHLDRLSIPTLVIHGGDDSLVPTPSSELLAGSTLVERRVFESLRHELLNEPEGPDVVREVLDWIKEKAGGG
ncbi:MAG TPA: lysophospholipase [Acidimicrobiia bacterium]|nr:lysophospholipase [Acidimicrobiia bacterium]